MTTLKYSDKYNMVAFLKKPNESVGFTEIVDFLKGTSLRYTLTHNPAIYDSLVKQFWQTATVRTLANGTPELVASIDNKEYTIIKASIRSKRQLADASGDHVPLLPAMLVGAAEDQGEASAIPAEPQHTPTDLVSSTSQPTITSTNEPLPQPSPPRQLDRQDTEIPQSQGPTFTHVADEATTTGVRVGTEGATTITSSLDAWLDSGNIHESPLRSHEAPLHEGHTSESAEDSLQLKELMVLVPKLVTRIANLEKELHQTKTTFGNAILTLVDRVKSLEVALKRKSKKVILSETEDEETENQGRKIQDIDDDPLVSLVKESMKEKDTDFVTHTKISASGEVQEQDISLTTLEAAKTLSQVISQKPKSTDKGIRYKRKTRSTSIEKDISTDLDADIEVNHGSKDFNTGSEDFNTGSLGVSTGSRPEEEAVRQVRLDALLAKRISEKEKLSEQQKKRKSEVQEAAQFYT
ncbi:hypothetical protein Tco_1015437 [Tanacetum coccineum]|uniref:Xylulose kinase-1 n=1 Tax=Tanacetum coccineum TaxID=301880 RepID=A0ABQ5FMN0_9ASTR